MIKKQIFIYFATIIEKCTLCKVQHFVELKIKCVFTLKKQNKMIKRIFLTFFTLAFLFISCDTKEEPNAPTSDSTDFVKKIIYPESGNFYATENGESIIVANPVIYDVVVKNSDPSDEWTDFCLQNLDVQAISNVIFNAVYHKKIIPYHYRMDTVLSIQDVKEIEKEVNKEGMAMLQFEEQWFLNEETFEMYKKVSYIIFGMELVNDNGDVYGYKPGFKIYLDKEHNNTELNQEL